MAWQHRNPDLPMPEWHTPNLGDTHPAVVEALRQAEADGVLEDVCSVILDEYAADIERVRAGQPPRRHTAAELRSIADRRRAA